jgi:signal transduction histidine kinase
MFSTHYKKKCRPDERALRLLDLLGRQAADIIDRAMAEEALRRERQALAETQARLRAVLQATGVGLWLNQMPLSGLTWDRQARELFFVPPAVEPTIELFWSRLHPDDREPTRVAVEAALRDRTLYAIDHRVVEPGTGRVRWIHSEGRGIYDGSGRLVRFDGVNYDITERKEFQKELERLVAERTASLQELVGELEHFSHTITHDMRAPLRAMRAFSEMLKDASRQRLGEEERSFVGRIITGAERMDALITDALNYSKAVRSELPLGPVDVERLVRGMLDTYPEFQAAQITIAGKLPLVMGNEAGLTQCFSNLIGNAVKFGRPGTRAKVRIGGEVLADGHHSGWVRLSVEDDGIGISKEMLPRVFHMFARGSSPLAGTGIGLALARKVVERMGGRIGVASELGRGSRFWVELKAGDVKREAAEALQLG